MSLGEKLLNLRKSKQLSQEEVADKLNVTRQTVSKWETDQSTPDFDKIEPLCKLYGITADELVTQTKIERKEKETNLLDESNSLSKKRAIGIGLGILLYFIAVVWVMITIPVTKMNPIVSSAIFLLICGVGTYVIVYTSMVYKKKEVEKEQPKNRKLKQIEDILALITVIIYLGISFTTYAWHITWMIWLIYALVIEIIKFMFSLKEDRK